MEEDSTEQNLLESILDGSMPPRDLDFSLLCKITGKFSEEQIIGHGGFAVVYKGVLQNSEVAVKRIRNCKTIDDKLFRQEVNSLTQVNHKNIVRFLGFCSKATHQRVKYKEQYIYPESREQLLCFEYMPKGSLEKYVTDELRGLEWNIRYNIIKGICEGLKYLHNDAQLVHMDLKPANILLDNGMMAKISDFGLSRMIKHLRTTTTNCLGTMGYRAPEYIDYGKISVKCDVYSLGVIIIELVTGHKGTPNKNNVLRRWMHRWNKSGKETPFIYKQVAKMIDIGLLCKERDPYKRPFMLKVINDINALESTNVEINNIDESTAGQISPYPEEDDMLGIEPLELRFPFQVNKHTSCTLQLTNKTDAYIAFSITFTSPLPYCIEHNKDVVAPQSMYSVNITLQPVEKALEDLRYTSDFIVRSTKVNDVLTYEAITEDMFHKEPDKMVDEVNITVLAEVQSKISLWTPGELIQFEPPQLCFPFFPNMRVPSLCSIKIVNITDQSVGFNIWLNNCNSASYHANVGRGILRPWSRQAVTIKRLPKEKELEDMQSKDDHVAVWNGIVAEGFETRDVTDYMIDEESKRFPIVLTKKGLCTSDELIQFDPPYLSFPFLANTRAPSVCSVKIVNVTDHRVGFNTWFKKHNSAVYHINPCRGILPPWTIQSVTIKRVPKENETEDTWCKDDVVSVWNGIVTEGVETRHIIDYMFAEESKRLHILSTKTGLCTLDELIQFDPPKLCFSFIPNTRVPSLCSVKIANVTDNCVGFNTWIKSNSALYYATTGQGILKPRSTETLMIKSVPMERESEDMKCKEDVVGVWNGIVAEGIETKDITNYMENEESMRFPIVLSMINSCTTNELIRIEPPELRFPFLPTSSHMSLVKIVNLTDHFIGFDIFESKTNVASYSTEPPCGILTPRSTQKLVVTRVANQEDSFQDMMNCKDKLFLWSSFVTEDVDAIYLKGSRSEMESKVLPIVFIETSSDELIKFDPPELRLPLLSNKSVLSKINMINVTDNYISFIICTKSDSARYYTDPWKGILPPRFTQVLMVTMVPEEKELRDTKFKDKFLAWSSVYYHGVQVRDDVTRITKLPIAPTEISSSTSAELIRFDPPELRFPILPKGKVLSLINIVNNTESYVGFSTYSMSTNAASYHSEPSRGILPPQSTQRLRVTREENKDSLKDILFNDKYFVWNSIVPEGAKGGDLCDYQVEQESKELPIVLS